MLIPLLLFLKSIFNWWWTIITNNGSLPSNKIKQTKNGFTPCQNTNEPISLELFNCASVDLDKKGEIELEHYKNIC